MKEIKKLFTNSFIIFVGATIGSVFSYLFNMFMGRMLGPAQYGNFTAILSLLMILSAAGAAIFTVSMRYSGELYANSNYIKLKKVFQAFSKYSFILGAVMLILGLLLINPIASFFVIDQSMAIVIAIISAVLSLILMVNKGVLQGAQDFKSVSIVSALEMLLRLGVGLLLVYWGMGLNGAVSALAISVGLTYLVTLLPLKKLFSRESAKNISNKVVINRAEIINYSWPTLVSTILLMLLLNIDIVFIKHYFEPHEAGLYAAISTIAKIIFYLTGPVVGVMFAMVSEKTTTGEKHYKILMLSILFTLIGSFLVLSVYVVAPATIIGFLYGSEYVQNFPILQEVGII